MKIGAEERLYNFFGRLLIETINQLIFKFYDKPINT